MHDWILDGIVHVTGSSDIGLCGTYVSRSIHAMQLPKVIYFLRKKLKSFFLGFYCLPSENLHSSIRAIWRSFYSL